MATSEQGETVETAAAAPEAAAAVSATQGEALLAFYGSESANSYASMMDEEMKKYIADVDAMLGAIAAVEGPVMDTCYGSGHMLGHIAKLQPERALCGVDLSPAMLAVAEPRAPTASLKTGNMLDMGSEKTDSYAGIINTFAVHHVNEPEARGAVKEYARILKPGGALYLAAWEGEGVLDMGTPGVCGLYHPKAAILSWVADAGLEVFMERTHLEVDFFNMNTMYVIARKPGPLSSSS